MRTSILVAKSHAVQASETMQRHLHAASEISRLSGDDKNGPGAGVHLPHTGSTGL